MFDDSDDELLTSDLINRIKVSKQFRKSMNKWKQFKQNFVDISINKSNQSMDSITDSVTNSVIQFIEDSELVVQVVRAESLSRRSRPFLSPDGCHESVTKQMTFTQIENQSTDTKAMDQQSHRYHEILDLVSSDEDDTHNSTDVPTIVITSSDDDYSDGSGADQSSKHTYYGNNKPYNGWLSPASGDPNHTIDFIDMNSERNKTDFEDSFLSAQSTQDLKTSTPFVSSENHIKRQVNDSLSSTVSDFSPVSLAKAQSSTHQNNDNFAKYRPGAHQYLDFEPNSHSRAQEMSSKYFAENRNKGVYRREINELIRDNDLNINTVKTRRLENKRIADVAKRVYDYCNECGLDIDSDDENDLVQHKNDNFNNKDDTGRVLVNIGHDKKEPDIYLAPKITEKVLPHQIGGIRFLYDNLIGSIRSFKLEDGFGCILSHSMGLGKTVQIIALVDIFLSHTSAKTVLIVMPINVLNNWIEEFNKWLPKRSRKFDVFNIDKLSPKPRDRQITVWHKSGGVLLIGYEKFLRMTTNCRISIDEPKGTDDANNAKRVLAALVNPGPHMIICDEGHRIKNESTGISRALKGVKTKRRVILSGYPLQNKLKEYYCMVDFVRPKFLGLMWEFTNTFERPITNGQCNDSTESDKLLMRERSHVLNNILKGFIQRRTEEVLKDMLPEKQEFVIFCKLSQKQRELLHQFLNVTLANKLDDQTGKISLFRTFVVCSKICNHPDIIYDIIERGGDFEEIDPESQPELFHYSWAKDQFENYQKQVLSNSSKMVILFDIIEETVAKREKLLIFSQWLFTLDLIERLLNSRTDAKWRKYKTYYRLDGQTNAAEREDMIQKFNSKDNESVSIFLISTKAGGMGINLTGANRIVIFDACWNPCHDAQASCRIYRPGQSKSCFIYRLISDNSMEKRIFNKQIFKQVMSKGVVDQQNIDFKLNQNEIRALLFELSKELEKIVDNNPLDRQVLSQIKDPILLSVCRKSQFCFSSVPKELNTFLEELKHLALTSEQKKKALLSFEESERLNQNLRTRSDPQLDSLANDLQKFKLK